MITTPAIRSAMYPRNLFIYCAYWGTWSRVLQWMNWAPAGHAARLIEQVEVNLTTPNVSDVSEWKKNEQVWIRCHCTTRSDKDIVTAELPGEVVDLMRLYLNEETIATLLHADLLPLIDFDKYRTVCNGGAPIWMITKGSADEHC